MLPRWGGLIFLSALSTSNHRDIAHGKTEVGFQREGQGVIEFLSLARHADANTHSMRGVRVTGYGKFRPVRSRCPAVLLPWGNPSPANAPAKSTKYDDIQALPISNGVQALPLKA